MRQREPWISNILPRKEGIVMRHKAKGVLFALLCLTTLLLLSACGGPESRIANTEKLKEDLSEQSLFKNYVDMLDISISDLEVIKRQTTVEDKTDQAWVHVDVSGPRVEGDMYYLMTYELYNDGWLLETTEVLDEREWMLVPLCGVDDEDIKYSLPAEAEIESIDTDLEMGIQTVTYTYTESFPYCDINHRRNLICSFGFSLNPPGMNSFGMWTTQNDADAGTVEEWHIDGTWKVVHRRDGWGGYSDIIEHYVTSIEGFDEAVRMHQHESGEYGEECQSVRIGTVKIEQYEQTDYYVTSKNEPIRSLPSELVCDVEVEIECNYNNRYNTDGQLYEYYITGYDTDMNWFYVSIFPDDIQGTTGFDDAIKVS